MSKFLDLSHFHNMHPSERAWLFGKGPGLDLFRQHEAGDLRICVNESLSRVNRPTYFFAHDEKPISHVANNWPTGCTAVLQPERAAFAVVNGIPASQICVYKKKQIDLRRFNLLSNNDSNGDWLLGISGTVHSAIHFCFHVGVRKISMIGFDGEGGYAGSLNLFEPTGGGHHKRIKNDTINLLTKLGVDFEFITQS